ncbi:MAG: glucosyl-3-phosphoglycerate synthase [Actinobacteria bacterium]|nr:glucosyl-3-phosphoglycerate synthase [Actinomycetota bacterium]
MTITPVETIDAAALAAAKGTTTVTVCLPAHNEAATVGRIIDAIRAELVVGVPLVDAIVVLDDASTDATAQVAREAGATVHSSARVLAPAGSRRGKGEAMWKSLAAVDTDLIVWVDADIVDFDTGFVTRLVGPLIDDPNCVFVKGHYDRPVGADGLPGGRVTELVARPALSLYHPHLTVFPQPLSGEIAARRSALVDLPFASGYGVDIGLLIDVVDRYGLDHVARADLGVRVHRNRPLAQLAPQAFEVLHTILRRAGVPTPSHPTLLDSDGDPVPTMIDDRPALDTLPPEWFSNRTPR